jgi:hypothetical protein
MLTDFLSGFTNYLEANTVFLGALVLVELGTHGQHLGHVGNRQLLV